MSLVSLATFKEYLPEVQGSGSDTELQNLLDRVESAIAEYIGFPKYFDDGFIAPQLSSRSYTLYIDSPFSDIPYMLPLPIRPVNSITSWHSDVERLYGSDTEIGSSEYDLDNVLGRLYLKTTSSKTIESGIRANKVVLNAGWDTAPEDLEHAICVYASSLQRGKQSQGKDSTTQRDVTVKFSTRRMPQEVKDLLYPFRVYRRMM